MQGHAGIDWQLLFAAGPNATIMLAVNAIANQRSVAAIWGHVPVLFGYGNIATGIWVWQHCNRQW